MFNRNRRYIATVAGLAIVFSVLCLLVRDLSAVDSSYSHAAADASVKYERDAEAYVEKRCLTPTGLREPDCSSKADEAKREGQRKEQDLAAQNITAWWTKIMGIAALIGMVLSVVGVFLVYTTYRATQATVNITQNLYALETKPLLTIRPIDGLNFLWDEDGVFGIRKKGEPNQPVLCEIKNSGRGPAILTGMKRIWVAGDRTVPPAPIDPDDRDKVAVTSMPVSTDGMIIPAESEKPIPRKPNEYLTFYGFLEYRDLAGNRFRSGFAFNYDPINFPGRGLITARFNTATHWYYQELGKNDEEKT